MRVLSVQSQHPTPQLLCQPCCCCTTGDFSREPLVSASTGTYPDHVFDYPPGDNRVLLDQLRQVVQPSSYGRNALLNPTGREGPGQTPLPSAAGFHAHRTQSRLKGRGNTPPPPRNSRGHPRTPKLWGTRRASGTLRGLAGTRGTPPPQPLGHPQHLRGIQGGLRPPGCAGPAAPRWLPAGSQAAPSREPLPRRHKARHIATAPGRSLRPGPDPARRHPRRLQTLPTPPGGGAHRSPG